MYGAPAWHDTSQPVQLGRHGSNFLDSCMQWYCLTRVWQQLPTVPSGYGDDSSKWDRTSYVRTSGIILHLAVTQHHPEGTKRKFSLMMLTKLASAIIGPNFQSCWLGHSVHGYMLYCAVLLISTRLQTLEANELLQLIQTHEGHCT